jgi:hypothetical protein
MANYSNVSTKHLHGTLSELAFLSKIMGEMSEDCARGDEFNPLETEECKFFYEFGSTLHKKMNEITDVLSERTKDNPDAQGFYKSVSQRLKTRFIGRSLRVRLKTG